MPSTWTDGTPSPIDAEHMAAPVADIPQEAIEAMRSELARAGIGPERIRQHLLSKLSGMSKAGSVEEGAASFNEAIRDLYFSGVVGGRVGASVDTAIDRFGEEVYNGGQIKALANDDGSFQIVHGTNSTVSMWLDNLTDMDAGSAAVYNPKTGRLRADARIVPIPGTDLNIGANSSAQSKRNRANNAAVNGNRRARKASREVNKRLSDPRTTEGRQLSSDDYAGRVGLCVCQDDQGNLVLQNCIICETNEGGIAEMYARELGTDVMKATIPDAGVINSEPGDTSIFHEKGMYIGKSDFGAMAAGVRRDKGKHSQVSPDVAKRMFAQNDAIRKQRDEEYKKAHGGQSRPEKTEAKREHERLLRKQRALRRSKAEQSIGTENEAIRLRGGGYIFPGETISRGGRKFTYDEIKAGAEISNGVNRSEATKSASKAATEAVDKETKRQNIKLGNKNRKQQQRAREEAIRKANADGRGAVTYREGKDKASGKTILLFEGDPGYEEALGYKTAKAYPAK